MPVTTNDNIQNNSPKSLDNKYMSNGLTAYTSVSNAHTSVIYRHKGLKVRISVDGEELEYWYKYAASAESDLIPVSIHKLSSGSNTGRAIPAGEFVKRILVNPASELTALKIGTASNGDQIMPEQIIPAGQWYNITVEQYFPSGVTFHFTGITSTTQIRIYVD